MYLTGTKYYYFLSYFILIIQFFDAFNWASPVRIVFEINLNQIVNCVILADAVDMETTIGTLIWFLHPIRIAAATKRMQTRLQTNWFVHYFIADRAGQNVLILSIVIGFLFDNVVFLAVFKFFQGWLLNFIRIFKPKLNI